jgi:glycosyltransferase involved in cell wall biosynthesis
MDKKTARYRINLSEIGFTILSPFENIHKNRYDIIIKAYVKLITRYPDTEMRLFCLCDKSDDGGYPIIDLYKQEFKNNNSDFSLHTGKIMLVESKDVFNDEIKNVVFNCVDVAVCCSETANIELNPLELMSVGIPQIITDAGAYGEYINESNGTPLKIQIHSYLANNGSSPYLSEVRTVNSEDVFLAMEKYLTNRQLLEQHSAAARKISSDWEINSADLINALI